MSKSIFRLYSARSGLQIESSPLIANTYWVRSPAPKASVASHNNRPLATQHPFSNKFIIGLSFAIYDSKRFIDPARLSLELSRSLHPAALIASLTVPYLRSRRLRFVAVVYIRQSLVTRRPPRLPEWSWSSYDTFVLYPGQSGIAIW